MKRQLISAMVSMALIGILGCNRATHDLNPDSSLDRVNQGPKLAPQRVTHGLTKVDKSNKLSFDVPAHALAPHLTGTFSSFVQGVGGARISDESADIELMVMTEDQYDAYINHRSAESLYAIEPSHDHSVSISLPTTQDEAAKYYVVFRRNTDGKGALWVNADLSVEFGFTQ